MKLRHRCKAHRCTDRSLCENGRTCVEPEAYLTVPPSLDTTVCVGWVGQFCNGTLLYTILAFNQRLCQAVPRACHQLVLTAVIRCMSPNYSLDTPLDERCLCA